LRSRFSITRPTEFVGEGPVERFDELGGGEVPDSVPGFDGGDAECYEHVRLAGAGRADEATFSAALIHSSEAR
jgi:hypothetical protein